MFENHIEISDDTTLILFDDADFFDIVQPADNENGSESVTLTKYELIKILKELINQ